ncbi:MAG: TorF family putative porin [Sphingomonas sp.]|uniref:TorF family putative porin n=1 Tax=Sphingomonas sp. TaxID=28214 RepID=UPI003F80C4F3
MRLSHISLGALALAIATPALADPLPASTPTPDATAAPTSATAAVDDPSPAPAPVAAADGDTAPPPPVSFSGSATLVSDYRFRGISQTNKHFAVQGGLTATTTAGFYASVWGSSIDDYIAAGSDQEIDLILGYKHTFKSGVTIDGGVLYYYYPGGAKGVNTDFVEPYLSVADTLGPATLKVTANYAPKQKAIWSGLPGRDKDDNLYLAGDLTVGIPKTPISLTGHLGHTFGPSYLSIGKEYTDWALGASVTYKQFTAGVSYVDTSKDLFAPTGKNISQGGVVFSLGVSF